MANNSDYYKYLTAFGVGAEFIIKKEKAATYALSQPTGAAIEPLAEKLFLQEVLQEVQWMWDNLDKPHTSDHFNIPANLVQSLERAIDEIQVTNTLPSTSAGVWVKASERVPQDSKSYFIKYGRNYKVCGGLRLINQLVSQGYIDIEWLDDSVQATPPINTQP